MRHFSAIRRHGELFSFLAGLAGSCAVAALIVLAARQSSQPAENPFEGREFDCVLDLGQYRIGDDETLLAGLSYEMLRDFASENGCTVNVRSFTRRERSLDSLRLGATDLVVLPKFDSIRHISHIDSVVKSVPICKELCWVMRESERDGMRRINAWLGDYTGRTEFKDMVARFRAMPSSSRPHRSFIEEQRLSPYDSIIRARADSIGWDWRMLAAVIYTESKFAINVTSKAGAKGLMQLMPLTVKVYGVRNALDPEENIRAGASYLGRLDRLFRRYASGDERLRYVFAAYNAGETRVLRRLNDSAAAGLSDSALLADIDSAAVGALRAAVDSTGAGGLRADADSTLTDALLASGDTAGAYRTQAGAASLSASMLPACADPTAAAPDSATDSAPDRPETDAAVTAYIDKIFENYRNFCRICGK